MSMNKIHFYLIYMIKHSQQIFYLIDIFSISCDMLFIIYVIKETWPKFCLITHILQKLSDDKIHGFGTCLFIVLVTKNINLMYFIYSQKYE